jgi:hypothetical protein
MRKAGSSLSSLLVLLSRGEKMKSRLPILCVLLCSAFGLPALTPNGIAAGKNAEVSGTPLQSIGQSAPPAGPGDAQNGAPFNLEVKIP